VARQIARPVPVPDQISLGFWESVQRCQLAVQRCSGCAEFHHPPVGICPYCLTDRLQFEPVSGRGRIVSFTVTYSGARHPAFQEREPYPLAIVELEEQRRLYLLTNPIVSNLAALDVGLPVVAEYPEEWPGVRLLQFRVV
jgi:uncharacterized protein